MHAAGAQVQLLRPKYTRVAYLQAFCKQYACKDLDDVDYQLRTLEKLHAFLDYWLESNATGKQTTDLFKSHLVLGVEGILLKYQGWLPKVSLKKDPHYLRLEKGLLDADTQACRCAFDLTLMLLVHHAT
jgi:hypothetical protein